MKKLCAMLIAGCAAIALTMGTTGCTSNKTKTPTKTPTTPTTPTGKTPTVTDKTKTTDKTDKTTDKTDKTTDKTDKTDKTTDKTDKTDKTAKTDVKLEIKAEPATVTVKQGKDATSKVTVTLGADLAKGAKLTSEVKGGKDGKGIKVAFASDELKATGDSVATITVADDAAEGDYTVTITATAEGATPASASAKVALKVEKK